MQDELEQRTRDYHSIGADVKVPEKFLLLISSRIFNYKNFLECLSDKYFGYCVVANCSLSGKRKHVTASPSPQNRS